MNKLELIASSEIITLQDVQNIKGFDNIEKENSKTLYDGIFDLNRKMYSDNIQQLKSMCDYSVDHYIRFGLNESTEKILNLYRK